MFVDMLHACRPKFNNWSWLLRSVNSTLFEYYDDICNIQRLYVPFMSIDTI